MRFFCVFLLVFVCVPPVSFAAQKCIAFGDVGYPNMPNELNAESDSSDWSLVYSHITIRGIGVCAETVGEMGDVADVLTYDSTVLTYDSSFGGVVVQNDNKYCWCRMQYPAVSAWISYGGAYDAEDCLSSCSTNCTDIVVEPELRSAMLGNLLY